MLTYPAILILVVLTDLHGVRTADWAYWGENGPDKWPGLCQTGKKQSPINIISESAIKKDLGDLKFIRYDYAFLGKVINNGHTIQVQLSNTLPIQLESQYLSSKYNLEQFHFHWGSEHTIDKYRYPLEMHLVHYDEQYGNVTAASQHENGVAVVATFFELSDKDNQAMDPILKAAKQVSAWVGSSSTSLRDKVIPHLLLPKDRTTYYTYEGSLTTPKCQESVTWFVMSETVAISEAQLKIFHNVSSPDGILSFNYRPIQAIGDREVFHHLSGYSSSRSNFSVHIYLALLCTFLIRLS
ncbi:hypothetical protein KPH14_011426 [Odynerus spinipes]|uniref:Carbonic anhydrase n=1 Tax=Odynerus spinipes TaxID=1348599 RepID=A0AAD9VTU7_9HYME|nr:hypothetical protein KPH14_011426 [Odynerus spinipes]